MSVGSLIDGAALTWEQYVALGEDVRAEFIDGHLVLSPSPTREHQKACRRMANLLEAALAGTVPAVQPPQVAAVAWAWKPAEDEFTPDVMVFPETDESVRLTGRPVLVVEVLSTGRGDDLVVKSGKYAAAGLGHWWVLDLRHGLLDAFVLAEHAGAAGGYQRATRLDATAQVGPATAVVSFGVAAAHVDLPQLLT